MVIWHSNINQLNALSTLVDLLNTYTPRYYALSVNDNSFQWSPEYILDFVRADFSGPAICILFNAAHYSLILFLCTNGDIIWLLHKAAILFNTVHIQEKSR